MIEPLGFVVQDQPASAGPSFAPRPRGGSLSKRRDWVAWGLLTFSFGITYLPVMMGLVHDWWTDGNYSHGFLIVPLAGYLAWERRARLRAAAPKPSALGLG